MSRFLLLCASLCTALLSLGQDYTLTVEEHDTDIVPGLTTYRLYVDMLDATDFLSAVFGNENNPFYLNTPELFYNDVFATGATGLGINPAFLGFVPSLAADSWVTIGYDTSALGGTVGTLEDASSPWIGSFLATSPLSGQSVAIESVTGGTWFVTVPEAGAYAGASGRVLLMQVTATGISGTINTQIFPLGIGACQKQISFEFDGLGTFDGVAISNNCACTDEDASNYDETASTDDGSCSGTKSAYC